MGRAYANHRATDTVYRRGVNRREFLQWSGAGAAATLVPGCGPIVTASPPLGPPGDPTTGTAADGAADGGVAMADDAGSDESLEVEQRPIAVERPAPGTIIGAPQPADDPPMLGEVRRFAGNFVPAGWLPCDGRLLEIAAYGPLYSVIGFRFGGRGVTTFGLPDLRDRAPIGAGARHPEASHGGADDLATVEVAAGAGARVTAAGNNRQPQLTVQHLIAVAGVMPAWPT